MPDVQFGIDASGAVRGAEQFDQAASKVVTGAQRGSAAVQILVEQIKMLNSLGLGTSGPIAQITQLARVTEAAGVAQRATTSAVLTGAAAEGEAARQTQATTAAREKAASATQILYQRATELASAYRSGNSDIDRLVQGLVAQEAATRKAAQAQATLLSTMGGENRALSQQAVGASRIMISQAGGSVTPETAATQLGKLPEIFSTANINAKDLRLNMSAMRTQLEGLNAIGGLQLGPVSDIAMKMAMTVQSLQSIRAVLTSLGGGGSSGAAKAVRDAIAAGGMRNLADVTRGSVAPAAAGTAVVAEAGAGIGAGMIGAAAGVVAITAAVAAFVKVGKDAIKSAQEQENADQQMRAALISTSQYTDQYYNSLRQLADQFQNTTTYGNETVLGVERQLVSFGAAKQQIPALTRAVLDLSTGLGKDLSGATMIMGKALAGEFGTLSRYGIVVNANASYTEKLNSVLRQVQQRYGGSAAAEINTYSGAVTQAKNSIDDFLKELGYVVTKSPLVIGALHGVRDEFNALSAGNFTAPNWLNDLLTHVAPVYAMVAAIQALRNAAEGPVVLKPISSHDQQTELNRDDRLLQEAINKAIRDRNDATTRQNALDAGRAETLQAEVVRLQAAATLDQQRLELAQAQGASVRELAALNQKLYTDKTAATAAEMAQIEAQIKREKQAVSDLGAARQPEQQAQAELRLAGLQAQLAAQDKAQRGNEIEQRRSIIGLIQIQLQSTVAAIDAERTGLETMLSLDTNRLGMAQAYTRPLQEQLAIAAQIDAIQKRILDTQIAEKEAQRLALPTGPGSDAARALIDAQTAGLRMQRDMIDQITGGVQRLREGEFARLDSVVVGIGDHLTDSLTTAFTTGKLQARDFAQSVLTDLTKYAISEEITKPMFDVLRGSLRTSMLGANPLATTAAQANTAAAPTNAMTEVAKVTQSGFFNMIENVGSGFKHLVEGIGTQFQGITSSIIGMLIGSMGGSGWDSVGLAFLGGFGSRLLGSAIGPSSSTYGGGSTTGGTGGVGSWAEAPTGVPAYASGGIVRRPTLALIGEAGPEKIEPLNSTNSQNQPQTVINVPVTIAVTSLDPGRAADVIMANMPLITSEVQRRIDRGQSLSRSVGRKR